MKKEYFIVKAKTLKPKDVIIHQGSKFQVSHCGCGKGAGSFDFGEYFWTKGNFIASNGFKSPDRTFWLFQESPIIKYKNAKSNKRTNQ